MTIVFKTNCALKRLNYSGEATCVPSKSKPGFLEIRGKEGKLLVEVRQSLVELISHTTLDITEGK